MKGDLGETENSLADDEASSGWEHQKSRDESPQLERGFCGRATAQMDVHTDGAVAGLRKCEATSRVDVPTAPQQRYVFVISLMSSNL